MGKMKELWQDRIDATHKLYMNGTLTTEEATEALVHLGLDYTYAVDSLASVERDGQTSG